MAVNVEAVKDIVSQPADPKAQESDEFNRQPFEHPKLTPVDNLNINDPREIVGKEQLSALANKVGMMDVVRWKPRLVRFCASATLAQSIANSCIARSPRSEWCRSCADWCRHGHRRRPNTAARQRCRKPACPRAHTGTNLPKLMAYLRMRRCRTVCTHTLYVFLIHCTI